jgi:hypothetical protein
VKELQDEEKRQQDSLAFLHGEEDSLIFLNM